MKVIIIGVLSGLIMFFMLVGLASVMPTAEELIPTAKVLLNQ